MDVRSHSGQALVILLAFIASLVGGFLVVFSVGQTVNDKMKLQNAADAAAYSAAIWQARSLNYQAYLNRAIVANEVAIAQLVSLRSWSAYIGQTTRNVSRVASFVPPLAAPMRALAQGWSSVDRGIQASASPLEGGLSRWNVDVLSMAQAIAHQQAPIAAADLVTQVAQANDRRFEVAGATRLLQIRNAAQWQSSSRNVRSGEGGLNRFTALLMRSRDGFMSVAAGSFHPDRPCRFRGEVEPISSANTAGAVSTRSRCTSTSSRRTGVAGGMGVPLTAATAIARRGLTVAVCVAIHALPTGHQPADTA